MLVWPREIDCYGGLVHSSPPIMASRLDWCKDLMEYTGWVIGTSLERVMK